MRAQQCNAIWRTTRPLSGPCLNGVLNWHRCRLIVRVFVSGGRSSPRLSEKPDCRSDQRGCPHRRGDRNSCSLHVSYGSDSEVGRCNHDFRSSPNSRHSWSGCGVRKVPTGDIVPVSDVLASFGLCLRDLPCLREREIEGSQHPS